MDFSCKKPNGDFQGLKPKSGIYEVPPIMTYGVQSTRNKVEPVHPLEKSEQNYAAEQDRIHMRVLRATQGMHAPLRLQMERRAADMAGGRLSFLPSERLGAQVLRGNDTTIDFGDVLNMPENRERMGQPSAEMERALGLL
ncbi:hypothetical protein B566_EDAN007876 [Ephemera danica]|nr:hypothetical protein B566_EDAN007876 [Ephemera danica]